jgi:periplasmic copper chaperone A
MSSPIRTALRAAAMPFNRLRSIEERVGIAGFSLALVIAMSHPLWAHGYEAGDIEIDHPWSRATPEGARVAAGYLTLRNDGNEADRLVAVTGEIAGRTEIHEMAVNDQGVMTMRLLADGVEIPAGGVVELKPGGFHIMFLDLSEAPREGASFSGTLTFENAGTVEVEFSVEGMGGSGGHSHGHGHGESHDHGTHEGHGSHGR